MVDLIVELLEQMVIAGAIQCLSCTGWFHTYRQRQALRFLEDVPGKYLRAAGEL